MKISYVIFVSLIMNLGTVYADEPISKISCKLFEHSTNDSHTSSMELMGKADQVLKKGFATVEINSSKVKATAMFSRETETSFEVGIFMKDSKDKNLSALNANIEAKLNNNTTLWTGDLQFSDTPSAVTVRYSLQCFIK